MAASEEGALRVGFFSLAETAEALGSSEQALRLILSIFLGYPFALFQRRFLFQKELYLIHLYNTLTGLSLAYFNFGPQLCHSLLCVFVQFLILRLMGRTVTAIATSFCFQMAYLMAGYYYTATENYDIKWTMPHCVLTLKLIGLVIDYYDGRKKVEDLTPEQQKYAVKGVPTLLEVAGFSYFYGAFMVGPQFSMTQYQKLVKGELTDVPGQRPNSLVPALKRMLLGFFFMVIHTITAPYFTEEHLVSDAYLEQPFWFRCLYIMMWGKIILYKYVTCWLVTEGVCILSGLGYNGKDIHGRPKWNACANMKVWLFETTPYFTGTIASFNTNTNDWVARYIYKRLKFLGNKLVSQAISLLFLAVWHGLHCGYLVCFQMEFLIVIVERQISLSEAPATSFGYFLKSMGQFAMLLNVAFQHWVGLDRTHVNLEIFPTKNAKMQLNALQVLQEAISLVQDSPLLATLASITILRPIFYVLQQTIHWMFMGYSLVPFCLFSWDKWLKVYQSIYFLGHLLFFSLLFALPYMRKALVPRKEKLKKAE